MKLVSLLLFSSLIFCTATAGTIYKYKDENGNTVFSQTSCGDDAETQNIEDVSVTGGSSKSATQQLEEMRAIRQSGKSASSTRKPSASKTDCPPMSHVARRNKVVGDEVFKCMTQSELSDVVGRGPDSVRRGSDGEESWHWHLGNNSFHAFFDNKGRLIYLHDNLRYHTPDNLSTAWITRRLMGSTWKTGSEPVVFLKFVYQDSHRFGQRRYIWRHCSYVVLRAGLF